MKKYLSILLALLMLIGLIACAANTTEDSSSSTTSGEDDDEITTSTDTTTKPNNIPNTPPSITPINGGVVSVDESYVVREGSVVALEVNLSLPVADISENDEVEQKLAAHLEEIKQDITDYVSDLEEYCKNTVAIGGAHLFTPRITVSFVLNHFTEKAMSLSVNITEVNSHGVTTRLSRHYNYEFDFASNVTFGAFFSDSDKVTEAVCERLSERHDLYGNAAELIPALIADSWYFSDNEIVFIFNPYDIAPASSGFIGVTFTTDELEEFMSDYGKDLLGIT